MSCNHSFHFPAALIIAVVMLFLTGLLALPSVQPGAVSLTAAIESGDRNHVRQAITNGSPINEVDIGGLRPIHLAILRNDCAMVRLLLESGASPRLTDRFGFDPIMRAVAMNNTEILESLIEFQAPVNATDRAYNALAVAAFSDPQLVRILLEAGAAPNQIGRDGYLPLVNAVVADEPESVRLLLAAGADPDAKSKDGSNARRTASESPGSQCAALIASATSSSRAKS